MTSETAKAIETECQLCDGCGEVEIAPHGDLRASDTYGCPLCMSREFAEERAVSKSAAEAQQREIEELTRKADQVAPLKRKLEGAIDRERHVRIEAAAFRDRDKTQRQEIDEQSKLIDTLQNSLMNEQAAAYAEAAAPRERVDAQQREIEIRDTKISVLAFHGIERENEAVALRERMKVRDQRWIDLIRESQKSVEENVASIREKFPFLADEARSRELASSYLDDLIACHEIQLKIDALDAASALTPAAPTGETE